MSQVKLNTDLFSEIFPHFVAVDPDGPFTLMLVCTAWQDIVLKRPILWSRISLDDEIGDMEARVVICTTLSAGHPLNLILHLPISPSLLQIIHPYVHRVQSVFVDYPLDMETYTAAVHVFNLIGRLQLHNALFSFVSGGIDTPYCPAELEEILEKHSKQSLDSPTYPSNMITALILRGPSGQVSLHKLLTWLLSNIHLTYMEINFNLLEVERIRFKDTSIPSKELDEALPIVSLPFLRTLNMWQLSRNHGIAADFLRYIQSPNPCAISLNGYQDALIAVICELGVGLRPSEMTLNIDTASRALSDIKLEKVKRALSSVRSLHIQCADSERSAAFQIQKLLQCLPRSAVLRINTHQSDPQILYLVDHPPHLLQLKYSLDRGIFINTSPTVPGWCRSSGRFDSLSLGGYVVGEIASFCKKLFLNGAETSQNFLDSSPSQGIEELHCDSNVGERGILYHPKFGGMDKLTKLTCTFSFALALLKRQRLPMLQELVLIIPTDPYSIYISDTIPEDCLGPITDLLMESSDGCAPMRVLSIPIWTPWEYLFKVAKMLSQGNDSGSNPVLFLPSFPHPRLLLPLVDSLNGEPVTQMPDFSTYIPKASCKTKGICYECRNGGWTCADVKRCRRGRRGGLVAITRYTLSS